MIHVERHNGHKQLEIGHDVPGNVLPGHTAGFHVARKVDKQDHLFQKEARRHDKRIGFNVAFLLHEGEKAGPAFRRGKLAKFNEGIEIPAQIGFAAMAGYCPDDFVYDGSCSVTSQIISYDYLWNEVRVKGGAYGTWLNISRAAGVAFSSYRDPHCANSLDVYTKAADHLREVADENDFENFVIAAYGSANPLLTPASESSNAENMWLSELPFTLLEQRREEMLKTDAAKLRESADLLDYICAHSTVCVIGGAEILKACGDKLDKITKMSDNG